MLQVFYCVHRERKRQLQRMWTDIGFQRPLRSLDIPAKLPPFQSTSLPDYLPDRLLIYQDTSLPDYLPARLHLCQTTTLPNYLPAGLPPCKTTFLPDYFPARLLPCETTSLSNYLPAKLSPCQTTLPPWSDHKNGKDIYFDDIRKEKVECVGAHTFREANVPVCFHRRNDFTSVGAKTLYENRKKNFL